MTTETQKPKIVSLNNTVVKALLDTIREIKHEHLDVVEYRTDFDVTGEYVVNMKLQVRGRR